MTVGDKQRTYWRKWYHENKHDATKRIYFNRYSRRSKLRAWLDDFKKISKCMKCGASHPAVIEFHHRDPNKKEFSIGEVHHRTQSISRLKKEIDKCDIYCSNCHKILHYDINRGVAQLGSASALGAEGSQFKSEHPDHRRVAQ